MPKVDLTIEQCAMLGKLMDSVQGMENARVLLPIYDAIRIAVEEEKAAIEAGPQIEPARRTAAAVKKPEKNNTP